MARELKPEERLQVYVVRRLRDVLPRDCEWCAIEQGVKLSGTPIQRANAWKRLENKGVKAGVVDLHFWWQRQYACIELKWGKNPVTDAEERFMAGIQAAGFYAAAAWSAAEVERHLTASGIPLSGTLDGIDARLEVEAPPRKPRKASSKPRAEKPERKALAAMERARARGVFA